MDMMHTICRVGSPDRIRVSDDSYLGGAFRAYSYVFEAEDCTEGKVPNSAECVAILRANRYCCNFSLNFKVVGFNETIDGVSGPGIAWQVWDVNQTAGDCAYWLHQQG